MSKINFYIALFIFSNLFARQSNLDGAVNILFAQQIKLFSNQKVTPELENYIRAIAAELKMTKEFEIRTMNQAAIKAHGATNAFVIGSYLFVCPLFLETLSESEKRHLIGHELMHIEKSHSIKNVVGTSLLFYASYFGVYYLIKKNKRDDFEKLLSYSLIPVLPILAFLSSQAQRRAHEFEADRESALRLNEIDGGISLMNTFKYYDKKNYSSYFSRIAATHPSLDERIAQFNSLKNIEGQNAK